MKALVVVCSDSVAAGRSADSTGLLLAEGLRQLGCQVDPVVVVPDEVEAIAAVLVGGDHQVVVATGGTGLGPRDVTPEAVRRVIDRELPGFGEAFRALGRVKNPLADLSRAVAGTHAGRIVVAVPGSPGAVADALQVLGPLLAHATAVAGGDDHRGYVRDTPLSAHEASAAVQRDDAGAVVVFEGRVRDHDGGRAVDSLLYEAHPDADGVMRKVLAEALGRPGVLAAAAFHRHGELRIGDLAFVAAVSAAHRQAAFEVGGWLVDAVKEQLPVWKLQRFTDGTQEWVNCA